MGEHISPVERVKICTGVKVLLPVFSPARHSTYVCRAKLQKMKYNFYQVFEDTDIHVLSILMVLSSKGSKLGWILCSRQGQMTKKFYQMFSQLNCV